MTVAVAVAVAVVAWWQVKRIKETLTQRRGRRGEDDQEIRRWHGQGGDVASEKISRTG